MKIIIDNIIFAWQKSGGISVVWHEIIKRLLGMEQLSGKLGFVNFEGSNDNMFFRDLAINDSQVVRRETSTHFTIKRYLSQRLSANEPFIYHSTYYRVCSNVNAVNVVTVHDFTYERFAHGIKRWLHSWSKRRALLKADYIVCISESTKNDLLEFIPGLSSDKIRVIYNGASEDFRKLPDGERNTGEEPFLVFVGSRATYKNYTLAVKAASLAGMKLCIVGGKLTATERAITKKYLGNSFEELGRISNDALNRLYNKAFALIYPSLYEGFGLPVVEAQKAGCPVLALDTSSISEIIGNREQLVTEASPKAFLRQSERLKQLEYRNEIVSQGIENAKRYSWDNTVKQYILLYEEIMKQYSQYC